MRNGDWEYGVRIWECGLRSEILGMRFGVYEIWRDLELRDESDRAKPRIWMRKI